MMGKRMLTAAVLGAFVAGLVCAQGAGKAKFASTDEQFDPIAVGDSITFAQMREKLGAIPKVSGEVKFAGNVKAFENEFWRTIAEGYNAFAANAKKNGVSLIAETRSPQGENDEEGQLMIIKDQIRKKYNAILLSPISDGNCLPGVDEAHKAGVPVFSVNNEFNGCDIYIGPQNKTSGALAAQWIAKAINGKGKVAIVMGMPKSAVTRNRTGGFEAWMKDNAKGIQVVEKQNADWDRSRAKDITQTWLKKHKDLKAVFCNNDIMAMGVIEAIKESNLKLNKDIFVVGVDGAKEAYASIKAGEQGATIDYYPFYEGQVAAEVAMRYMAGQKLPRVVWTPQVVLDATNVNKTQAENVGWIEPSFK